MQDDNDTPYKRWFRKLKADPIRYAAWLEKEEADKADPEKRARKRQLEKARLERMALEEPEKYAEYLARRRGQSTKWKSENREKGREQYSRWYHERGGKEQYQAKRNGDPAEILKNWERNLRAKFGIGPADYHEMLERQGGKCAICEKSPSDDRRLAVDHCHATGRVRGLLCFDCNSSLGKFGDSVGMLKAAIAYLERKE